MKSLSVSVDILGFFNLAEFCSLQLERDFCALANDFLRQQQVCSPSAVPQPTNACRAVPGSAHKGAVEVV